MKKAFTLIELIIAIAIFSIIIVYLYQAIYTTKKSILIYENMHQKTQTIDRVKNLFYNDIFNQTDPYANTSVITKDKFSTYYLRSNNSLFALSSPFIAYKVINSKLYRFESVAPFNLPLNEKNQNKIKLNVIATNVTHFTIYSYKNSRIIDIITDEQRTFFEVSLPYSKKVIMVESPKK